MNLKLMIGIAAISAMGLTACDEAAKLAGQVEGTWSAPKTEMALADKGHKEKSHKDGKKDDKGGRPDMKPIMACTPTITFTRTSGTNGGDLTISGDYEMSQSVSVTDTVVPAPVKATVQGSIKAAGTWMAKDDDEIIVTLDASKTSVSVDPATLALDYAKLTDASSAGLESIKANVAKNIVSTVTPMLQQRIGRLHKFDYVKVTGNTMKVEIGKTKLTFTKK